MSDMELDQLRALGYVVGEGQVGVEEAKGGSRKRGK